jgi:uncharacterized protein
MDLLHMAKIYERDKKNSLCLDIETDGIKGPITLVGLYNPNEGTINHKYFLRGQNLNKGNLKEAFRNCKMLVTYNGEEWDVPRIKRGFRDVVPDVPIIDLMKISNGLGIRTSLKVMENTFNIDRMDSYSKKRHIATKLWRRWRDKQNKDALAKLIEYNKQDTINLYPLAEELVGMIRKAYDQEEIKPASEYFGERFRL